MDKNLRGSVFNAVFISGAISMLLYAVFFYYAPFIRSFNQSLPIENFTELAREYVGQNDGIETYVLYALILTNIFVSFIASLIINAMKSYSFKKVLLFTAFSFTCLYFFKLGFNPPMNTIASFTANHYFLTCTVALALLVLVLINYYFSPGVGIIAAVLLFYMCMVATDVYHILDYNYIFAPALRILQGAHLSEIYFQYDVLLSLLALPFLKFHINLDLFQILGQASVYILILGLYFFTKKMFRDKNLPVFLLFALVIIRLYANILDPSAVFEVTPLRLDLWFVLVPIVYFFGTYSIFVGIALGSLIFLSKSFGTIYLLAYLELLLAVFIIEFIEKLNNKQLTITSFYYLIIDQVKKSAINIVLICAGFFIYYFVFKSKGLEASSQYLKYGIGFIPVADKSFYWYVPLLLSSLVCLVIKAKKILPEKYTQTTIFIALLAVGNLIYFFGRSHENNLINLSAVLVTSLFLFFDVVFAIYNSQYNNVEKTKAVVINALKLTIPLIVILVMTISYADRILQKGNIQFSNIKHHLFYYPGQSAPDAAEMKFIKDNTNNSDKVFFLSVTRDFLFYYYGNYKPRGYFNPFSAWIFKKDLAYFLQDLIDKGYYLVVDGSNIGDLLTCIKYKKLVKKKSYTFIWTPQI